MNNLKRKLIAIFSFTLIITGGYATTKLPLYWSNGLITDGVIWVAVCLSIALLLRHWQPNTASISYIALLAIYLICGVGVIASLAIIYLFASTLAMGHLICLCLYGRKSRSSHTEAGALGLAIYVAIWSALVHFPLNWRWLYLIILSLPLALTLHMDRAHCKANCTNYLAAIKQWAISAPFSIIVICGCLVGWISRFAFFPTIGYDDNAQHLRIWTELLYNNSYSFDIKTQIWAAAPFAVDLLHAIVSIVAGVDARGAFDLGLFILLLTQTKIILNQFHLKKSDQFLLLLLLASTPVIGILLTSLQTELFLALLCVIGTRLALTCDEGWDGRNTVAVCSIAALCTATKLPGIVLGAFIIAAMLIRLILWKPLSTTSSRKLNKKALIITLGALAFSAFHSYGAAYIYTGNPVFPLYNGVFKSDLFRPQNFFDKRWKTGFSAFNYIQAFFNTTLFFEAKNYTAGFQYLILSPIAIATIIYKRLPHLMLLMLIPMLGFGLVMFHATQYWRYMFPIAPLACVIIAILLPPANSDNFASLWRGVIIGSIALNLYFFPGVSWLFTFPLQDLYTSKGKDMLRSSIAGDQEIIRELNSRSPGSRVLFVDRPYGAMLNGFPIYTNWYSPRTNKKFAKIQSIEDAASFIQNEDIQFTLFSLGDQSRLGKPAWFLREYLSKAAYPMQREGMYVLYRNTLIKNQYQNIFSLRRFLSKSATSLSGLNDEILISANSTPRFITEIDIRKALIARYHVKFICPSEKGEFVAQLNWDIGPPYYRLVPCTTNATSFSESVPIPVGANKAGLYITVRNASSAKISQISIDIM